MSEDAYVIVGGDYDLAGQASSGLKARLKKLGIDGAVLRRVIIAAYEAETNVVIHAAKGVMRVALAPEQVDVEVVDEGPGIADIGRAMTEGFSTAPPRARELGFGAGMGLPNIRKNADRFEIHSTVGQGTRVAFTVYLRRQEVRGMARHSLRVRGESCRQCLHCLRACPTHALRVRDGSPVVLEHLCIDCALCMGACTAGALEVAAAGKMRKPAEETVLLLPAALLAQFGPGFGPGRVLGALSAAGFRAVYTLESWEAALRVAGLEYAQTGARHRPVIAPVCPPVVNLIETRFPSLIGHLAPFLSPVQAACEQLAGRDLMVVVACAGQCTAVSARNGQRVEVLLPAQVRETVGPLLAAAPRVVPVGRPADADDAEATDAVFRVTGLRHVVNALEAAENDRLGDVRFVEPFICDQGCFGSPLMREDGFLARRRWLAEGGACCAAAKALRREAPYAARPGMRLDPDMRAAIAKLAQIDELLRGLPGRDCTMCGAPTCAALAEDVVLGRAALTACMHLPQERQT